MYYFTTYSHWYSKSANNIIDGNLYYINSLVSPSVRHTLQIGKNISQNVIKMVKIRLYKTILSKNDFFHFLSIYLP